MFRVKYARNNRKIATDCTKTGTVVMADGVFVVTKIHYVGDVNF
jgi:hypothetical protein